MPDYVNTSSAQIEQELISIFEQQSGMSADPASPERLLIEWAASAFNSLYSRLQFAASQNIPSSASGEYLDALGEIFAGAERPAAQKAIATQRFWISATQETDIIIPAGTRVTTPSGNVYFKTVEDATIAAGDTYTDTLVECESAGTGGNGYAAGQLSVIVDVYEYYATTTNLDTSSGGASAMNDDEYREYLRRSVNAVSVAGPRSAYEFLARSVSKDIKDVRVIRPYETTIITVPVVNRQAKFVVDGLVVSSIHIQDCEVGVDYNVNYSNSVCTITAIVGGEMTSNEVGVSFQREAPCRVAIYAIMQDGTIAPSAIKTAILAKCSADDVRPLTDNVSVEDPVLHPYNITFSYYVHRTVKLSQAEVHARVLAAVDEYKAWQSDKMGRDIIPDKLREFVMKTGIVKRIVAAAPTYGSLTNGSDGNPPEIAYCNNQQVSFGGYEDE